MKFHVINKLLIRNFKTTLTLKSHHIFNNQLEYYVHRQDDAVFHDHRTITKILHNSFAF